MTTNKQTRSDDSIRDDVLFELKWDPKINSSDIAVAVKNGVATLSGFASSYWEDWKPKRRRNASTESVELRTISA